MKKSDYLCISVFRILAAASQFLKKIFTLILFILLLVICLFVEREARLGPSPLFLREKDSERKCLWDIQVPLLCSLTVRQPTEPQVASGHRERMGTSPQRPARVAADTANKQPTLLVCTRLGNVLKDGRTSPQVSLSWVSKKQRCHPLKKVSQDRRSKNASM